MKNILISLVMALSLTACATVELTDFEKSLIQETAVQYAMAKVAAKDKDEVAFRLAEIRDLVEASSYTREEIVDVLRAEVDKMDVLPEDKAALKVVIIIAVTRADIPEVPFRDQIVANLNTAIEYLW